MNTIRRSLNMPVVIMALAFVTFFSTPVSAGVIFFDDFSADTPAAPTTGPLVNWTVTAGNIDLLGPGFGQALCDGGTGKCVDMNGSNFNASIETTSSLTLGPGNYKFEFRYGDNASGNDDNGLNFSVGTFVIGSVNTSLVDQPNHVTFMQTFNVLSASTADITFTSTGTADSQGAILDSVTLTQVPEPSTFLLLSMGLTGLVVSRRRRL